MASGWWGCSSLFVLLAIALWATPVRAQQLCPTTTYVEDALSGELGASLELRRGNGRALWAQESLCGRLELGAHYASLRVAHAFGQGEPLPATDAPDPGRLVNALRVMPEYRFLLRALEGGGSVFVESLMQYERDQARGIGGRVQWGIGPSLRLVDSFDLRLVLTLAYALGLDRGWPPASTWALEHVGWLDGELGWDLDDGIFLGEELLVQVPLETCPCQPRVYAQTTFRVRGNDWLSLESAFLVLYDRAQARLGLSRWDLLLRTGLVFSL